MTYPAPLPVPRPKLAVSDWWMCPRADSTARLRLWCLPFVGAGAAIWHPWAGPLAGCAEVAAVRLRGRETRLAESPFTRLDEIVRALADRIGPQTKEPYALCGHSLGGLLAFEIARELRARGLPAARALIVCATRAPHLPRLESDLHPLPAREFVAQIERRYGAIPPEIREHPEFIDLLLPAMRADMEAYETYRFTPGPPLDLPLLALGGTNDAIVPRASVMAWSAHTAQRFESHLIVGGHFFPQQKVGETTQLVRQFLARE
jgi:medium-chain acyl-[acyl-carrier-protein] hydrolase